MAMVAFNGRERRLPTFDGIEEDEDEDEEVVQS